MPRKSAGKPPADPSDSKSARTRERILDAAAHVLSRKGYAGTRLSDVAEQAEIQAPAIYYYFSSREVLIEEVMWVGVARLREHVAEALEALPPDTTPMDRIDTAVEEHLRYQLAISDFATAAIRNAGQVPEDIRTRQLAEERKYGDIWRTLLHDAQKAGELRADLEPRAARMLVLGALNWANEWWNPRQGSLDVVVRTAKSLVRHGLEVPNTQGQGGTRPSGGSRGRRTATSAGRTA
ncbi:TetR/AcrR family transcriptional regulator [Streptomyces sp. NPDC048420]|uniref:TetR/AcrR family transcriptional regulator n=1 Tax=Streptomyces sp. NPDC048420 TaxID=3155755 RepID=UPI0034377543